MGDIHPPRNMLCTSIHCYLSEWILWKGYNKVKAESPNADYQPWQLLDDKDTIDRVEENTQSICDIAKDCQDEHTHR